LNAVPYVDFDIDLGLLYVLQLVASVLQDHDGHGPEFHKHMYRINGEAGTSISVRTVFSQSMLVVARWLS